MNIEIDNTVPDLKITVTECEDGSILLSISKKPELQMLSSLPVGTHFMAADQEWIVLEHVDSFGTFVCRAEVLPDIYAFSKNGDANFAESALSAKLDTNYYDSLAEKLGLDAIMLHEVNLTADDGSGEDLSCNRYVSVMTTDQRRRYRKLVPRTDIDEWTATRRSWDAGSRRRGVCCIAADGAVVSGDCEWTFAVRPFMLLKSSINVEVLK